MEHASFLEPPTPGELIENAAETTTTAITVTWPAITSGSFDAYRVSLLGQQQPMYEKQLCFSFFSTSLMNLYLEHPPCSQSFCCCLTFYIYSVFIPRVNESVCLSVCLSVPLDIGYFVHDMKVWYERVELEL